MAAMLVAIAVMMIAMTAALPVMSTTARREKEAELIFRGKQYSRAIGAYQRKNGGASPPNIDELVNQRFLRKKFKDPITDEDFVLVTPASELPTTSNVPGLPPGTSTAGRATGSTTTTTGSRTGGTATTSTTTGGRSTSSISSTSSAASGLTSSTAPGTQAGATLGILGVRSKSKDKAFRVYNGLEHYDEWIFMATQAASRVGAPSGGAAGAGGRGGAAGGRGGQPTSAQPFGGGGRGAAPPPPPPPPSPFAR